MAGGLGCVVQDERQDPPNAGPSHPTAMDDAGRQHSRIAGAEMQADFRSLEALLTSDDVEDLWTGMSVDWRGRTGPEQG